MLRAIAVSFVALQLLLPRIGWADNAPVGAGERLTPMPIQYPQYYDQGHHHHGPVRIGCVPNPDECHYAAENAGYQHFRTVVDPNMCHHEPHLLCLAGE